MRATRLFGTALLAAALPVAAFAQSASSPSVSSLLAELTALEQQLGSLSGSATTVSAPTSAAQPVSGGLCPDLWRTLSLGSTGTDVTGLQTFLAGKGFFDTTATGYFGPLTQAAVGQWQEENGVVSGGSAGTTGLGVVGPKTRAAIEASCSGEATTGTASTQCLPVSAPNADCSTGWKPVTDQNGCAMYYQCVVALPSASTSTAGTSAATTSCPVVQQPLCTGQVVPFQTNSSGCVTAYECVL